MEREREGRREGEREEGGGEEGGEEERWGKDSPFICSDVD